MRPVVEFMYADFVLVAADQLFNQIAKVRHMFGGTYPAHLIVRVRVAGGHGYANWQGPIAGGLSALLDGKR